MISRPVLKDYFRTIFTDITALGSLFFYCILLIFLLLFRFYRLSFLIFVGLVIIYFVVYVIRFIYFKERPDKQRHSTFLEKLDAGSFPSLHAARTGFLFSVFGTLSNSVSLWIVLGFLSLLVLYSRYYLKKHHFVDLVGGSLIGFFLGTILLIIL